MTTHTHAPVSPTVDATDRKLVLAGNPNVGKSVVFNALTGLYVDVSNYPGTTIDISKGKADGYLVMDTPGVYGVASFNDEERVARDIILGEGRVSATLDGSTLRITGNFTGLSSPATAAKLGVAQGFGIPTTEFFATLTPTNGQAGSISGTLTLTPAQVAAVNGKQLFLQLNTVRGTDGALWGWFEPAQEKMKAAPSKGGKK